MEYICTACGCVFDEPYEYNEPHTELDGCPSETFSVCPHCMDPGYEEAEECDRCGHIWPHSRLTTLTLVDNTKVTVCDDCENDLERRGVVRWN